MNRFCIALLSLCACLGYLGRVAAFHVSPCTSGQGRGLCMSSAEADLSELKRVIRKEYASFFAPMERKFYSKEVEFVDPLSAFKGVDKYQGNIDFLAGRTPLGRLLFRDASIAMHDMADLPDGRIQTRWTLQLSVRALPWQPRARFTGVSIYTVDRAKGVVLKQEDFWDSINLKSGKYATVGLGPAVGDFLSQLRREDGAEMSAPELPYTLLRRSPLYEVRRYPATLNIQTPYAQRPEGYDRLGSYAGGSNVEAKRVPFFSPTLMTISDKAAPGEGEGEGKEGKERVVRRKTMSWPVAFAMPGQSLSDKATLPEPTIGKVSFTESAERVVAVTKFSLAATEPIARGYTKQLLSLLRNDGLTASAAAVAGDVTIGQFDALFSLNKRRVEVWVELDDHPWK